MVINIVFYVLSFFESKVIGYLSIKLHITETDLDGDRDHE